MICFSSSERQLFCGVSVGRLVLGILPSAKACPHVSAFVWKRNFFLSFFKKIHVHTSAGKQRFRNIFNILSWVMEFWWEEFTMDHHPYL